MDYEITFGEKMKYPDILTDEEWGDKSWESEISFDIDDRLKVLKLIKEDPDYRAYTCIEIENPKETWEETYKYVKGVLLKKDMKPNMSLYKYFVVRSEL